MKLVANFGRFDAQNNGNASTGQDRHFSYYGRHQLGRSHVVVQVQWRQVVDQLPVGQRIAGLILPCSGIQDEVIGVS